MAETVMFEKFRAAHLKMNEVIETVHRDLKRDLARLKRDPDLAAELAREEAKVLAHLRRAWVKYHHEDALVDAVYLCAEWRITRPKWLREALEEVGFKTMLGVKRRRKRGPHTDFLRNHDLFVLVQSYRDADKAHHLGTALLKVHSELKSEGIRISLDRLEGIYKSHRRLVTRRDGFWVRRARVYFPRRSGAFWFLREPA